MIYVRRKKKKNHLPEGRTFTVLDVQSSHKIKGVQKPHTPDLDKHKELVWKRQKTVGKKDHKSVKVE